MSNNSFHNMLNNIDKSTVAIPKGIKDNINNDYTLASILSKTIRDLGEARANQGPIVDPAEVMLSRLTEYEKVSKSTADRTMSNNDILDLFPDIEMCVRVLVSSIAAPNDMLRFGLNYEIENLSIPAAIKNNIVSVISEHLEKNYKIDSNLYEIIKEALFTKGAYVNFILPEASLDDIINSDIENTNFKTSTESFLRDNKIENNIRRLQDYTYSIESEDGEIIDFTEDDVGIYFSSDPRHLIKYMSYGTEYQAKKNLKDRMNLMLSTEDEGDTIDLPVQKNNSSSSSDFNDRLFNNVFRTMEKTAKQEKILFVKPEIDASRYSIGRPLVFKLPVESVIPLHLKSDPKSHIGYIVLVNEDGTIVNTNSEKEDKKSRINNMTGFGSNIGDVVTTSGHNATNYNSLSVVKKIKNAVQQSHTAPTIKDIELLYANILEDLITRKLKNANYIDIISIKNNTNLYNVMFTRYLKNKKTRVIYIPEELISYVAIDYRTNGTGYSLLEKTRYLNELRAVVMFVRLMNFIKNSIPRSKVVAQLPPSTLDPLKNIADIKTFVYNNRESMFPIGNINTLNPNELRDWYRKLGITFEFKSDVIPDISIDQEDATQQNMNSIDPEFEQDLYRKICLSFGLTPEMIDSTYNVEFAASVLSHNVLFSRYIISLQSKFNEKFTDLVRKLFINDKELIYDVKKIIDNYCKENKKSIIKLIKELVPEYEIPDNKNDEQETNYYLKLASVYIMREISQNLIAYLPKPQVNENIIQNENIDNLIMGVDKIMDAVFDQAILNEEIVGESAKYLEVIKGSIKTQLIQTQIRENKAFEPLTNYLDNDPNVSLQVNPFETVMGLSKQYNDNIISNIGQVMKLRDRYNDKLSKKLEDYGGLQELDTIPSSRERDELDQAKAQGELLKEVNQGQPQDGQEPPNDGNNPPPPPDDNSNNNENGDNPPPPPPPNNGNVPPPNGPNGQPSQESGVNQLKTYIKKLKKR